jgi:phosphoketolase
MKSLKHSTKSYPKICGELASAVALKTAKRRLSLEICVNHVNAGLRSSRHPMKMATIPHGIKTAKAPNGLKITGRWQNSSCLHLDLTLVPQKMLNLPIFLPFSTFWNG